MREKGITRYQLDRHGVAEISDDTQMSLFTGCIISEYDHYGSPEKERWDLKYCEFHHWAPRARRP